MGRVCAPARACVPTMCACHPVWGRGDSGRKDLLGGGAGICRMEAPPHLSRSAPGVSGGGAHSSQIPHRSSQPARNLGRGGAGQGRAGDTPPESRWEWGARSGGAHLLADPGHQGAPRARKRLRGRFARLRSLPPQIATWRVGVRVCGSARASPLRVRESPLCACARLHRSRRCSWSFDVCPPLQTPPRRGEAVAPRGRCRTLALWGAGEAGGRSRNSAQGRGGRARRGCTRRPGGRAGAQRVEKVLRPARGRGSNKGREVESWRGWGDRPGPR